MTFVVSILIAFQTAGTYERRALEQWMERARAEAQTRLIQKREAAQRADRYIEKLNGFSLLFNRCFVEDYKMGISEKKCNDEAIRKALEEFLKTER